MVSCPKYRSNVSYINPLEQKSFLHIMHVRSNNVYSTPKYYPKRECLVIYLQSFGLPIHLKA